MKRPILSYWPATWNGKGLFLIAFLILPVPLFSRIGHAPEITISSGTYEAMDADNLSRILASLREIRLAAERSSAVARTTLSSLDSDRPTALPTGLPVSGTVSSRFGLRLDPFSGFPEFHRGTDIAAARGTPVSATADGDVIRAGWEGDYGNSIMLAHPGGLATRYAHLDRILVRRGDPACKGAVIGTVGETGRATGAHLHYEALRDGRCIDPKPYLLAGDLGKEANP
jgi:murein DD-endopeptidase MepM/ murein hydrolase activator NlpD